jgi:carboxyl-terminal processing protease
LRDVVQLIRGKTGTVVLLTVRKPKGDVVIIPITRDVVQLDDVYAKSAVLALPGVDGHFAYIDLPKFYGRIRGRRGTMVPRYASLDIHNALVRLQNWQVRGLVLDLRGNSGGLLHEAIRVSGLFITTGPIVQTRAADGTRQVLRDKDKTLAFSGPVVVLVDRFSASASEILAAALQDYGRAVVVGATTHGKGTVQQLHSLDEAVDSARILPLDAPRLGVLKLTQYQFYRVNGDSTQLRGVIPDIPLPDVAAYLKVSERDKEYPIPWNAIEPASHIIWPHRWDVATLRHLSLARQTRNDAFIKVNARMALLQKQRDDTVEELEKDLWIQDRKSETAQFEALKIEETERFKVEPVEYQPDENTPAETRAEIAAEWAKTLQSDPWVEEAIRILGDIESSELLMLK